MQSGKTTINTCSLFHIYCLSITLSNIVHLVDIGEIVDHHRFNFLLITCMKCPKLIFKELSFEDINSVA